MPTRAPAVGHSRAPVAGARTQHRHPPARSSALYSARTHAHTRTHTDTRAHARIPRLTHLAPCSARPPAAPSALTDGAEFPPVAASDRPHTAHEYEDAPDSPAHPDAPAAEPRIAVRKPPPPTQAPLPMPRARGAGAEADSPADSDAGSRGSPSAGTRWISRIAVRLRRDRPTSAPGLPTTAPGLPTSAPGLRTSAPGPHMLIAERRVPIGRCGPAAYRRRRRCPGPRVGARDGARRRRGR
jgi:hypothetical protein